MTEENILTNDLIEKEHFIQYLNDYKVLKKNIKIAEKIDFRGIYNLFDTNFAELWEEITHIKTKQNLPYTKQEFKEKILSLARQSVFNILYLGISNIEIKGIDYDELNERIIKDFEKIMRNLFSVFEMEYRLLNPSKKFKKEMIVKSKLEKVKDEGNDIPVKKEKKSRKVISINYNPDDIKIYEKVIKEFNELNEKEGNTSLRKVALSIAESELNIKGKNELQLFYKEFVKYKRKTDRG